MIYWVCFQGCEAWNRRSRLIRVRSEGGGVGRFFGTFFEPLFIMKPIQTIKYSKSIFYALSNDVCRNLWGIFLIEIEAMDGDFDVPTTRDGVYTNNDNKTYATDYQLLKLTFCVMISASFWALMICSWCCEQNHFRNKVRGGLLCSATLRCVSSFTSLSDYETYANAYIFEMSIIFSFQKQRSWVMKCIPCFWMCYRFKNVRVVSDYFI